MSDDGTHSVSFTLRAGEVRETLDAGVKAFDDALDRVGDGEVMHFMDPRRIQTFEAGGPPVWSVASVPIGPDTLYLTYGLSGAIDPARGAGFEMSIRVRGPSTMWPALFLRGLCRYMITSGRALEVGQFMPFPAPMTRFAVAPMERAQMPDSALDASCFVEDPTLGHIQTPSGAVQVRRAVGMHPDELQLMELWSTAGFVSALAQRDPTFTTDIARPSYSTDAAVRAAVEEGSAREGSAFGFVAVPGVRWGEAQGGGITVELPGGHHASRIHRMLRARLPFGRHLLVHDDDPQNPLAVAIEPSEQVGMRVQGPTVVLNLPFEHPLLTTLENASPDGIRWDLS